MKEKRSKKEFKFEGAKRGARVLGTAKVSKTIRLDVDLVGWLLQESERRRVPYQTLINSMLNDVRRGMLVPAKVDASSSIADLEEVVRGIVKEELKRTG